MHTCFIREGLDAVHAHKHYSTEAGIAHILSENTIVLSEEMSIFSKAPDNVVEKQWFVITKEKMMGFSPP